MLPPERETRSGVAPGFAWAGCTDKGPIRSLNEDHFGARAVPGGLVALALDGAGGSCSGRPASERALAGFFGADFGEAPWEPGALLSALAAADLAVKAGPAEGPPDHGCATAVAAALGPSAARIAWVGDCRAYWLRAGVLVQITRDHTLIEKMIEVGKISRRDAIGHPHSNIILQALGFGTAEPDDTDLGALWPGHRLLLCSDGLWKTLSERQLRDGLEAPDPTAAATGLIDAAVAGGATDNATALVIERLATP